MMAKDDRLLPILTMPFKAQLPPFVNLADVLTQRWWGYNLGGDRRAIVLAGFRH